ncbi:MAG: hypothetical protein WCJ33_01765 [Pseudomonadota bacterium]
MIEKTAEDIDKIRQYIRLQRDKAVEKFRLAMISLEENSKEYEQDVINYASIGMFTNRLSQKETESY